MILVGFALPPLLQLRRVPPARVLRREPRAAAAALFVVYGLAIGALVGAAVLAGARREAGRLRRGGIAATFLVLALAGWVLVRALAPLRGGVGVAWRYGIANIARRGRDSVVQIVAFGLGFMVLLLLALVRNDLLRGLAREPAGRRAELLHDQHPARRRRRNCRAILRATRACRPPSSCRWCARA